MPDDTDATYALGYAVGRMAAELQAQEAVARVRTRWKYLCTIGLIPCTTRQEKTEALHLLIAQLFRLGVDPPRWEPQLTLLSAPP
jgi:hypothetical protein